MRQRVWLSVIKELKTVAEKLANREVPKKRLEELEIRGLELNA